MSTGTGIEALFGILDEHEGGGQYDTLFGYSQRDGRRFAGMDITTMTLDELSAFDREYGPWVRDQLAAQGARARIATPMGRGQIVGTTRRNVAEALGLSGDTLFNEQTQLQMIDYLARQRLQGVTDPAQRRAEMRAEWEGFRYVPDDQLDQAIAGYLAGGPYVPGQTAAPILAQTLDGQPVGPGGEYQLPGPLPDSVSLGSPAFAPLGTDPATFQGTPSGPALIGTPQGAISAPSTTISTQGGASPTQTGGPALSTPEESQTPGLMARLFGNRPDWLTDERQDALLALGTGLLSEATLAGGLASAGNQFMGLREEQRGIDFAQEDRAAQQQFAQQQAQVEQQYALERIAAQGAQSVRTAGATVSSRAAGNIQMADGTVAGNLIERAGRFYTPDGTDVSEQVQGRINSSDAFGTRALPTGNQMIGIQQNITRMQNELETFDRVYEGLNDVNYGIEGFATDMQTFVDTLLSRGLTPEQIQRASLQGEAQGLVGATREQVVGGGVMTEQDAMRVIAALGGDLSLLSNPEVMRHQIEIFRGQLLNQYTTMFDQYDATRTAFPNAPYIELPRYEGGPALDSSNVDPAPQALPNQQEIEDLLIELGI